MKIVLPTNGKQKKKNLSIPTEQNLGAKILILYQDYGHFIDQDLESLASTFNTIAIKLDSFRKKLIAIKRLFTANCLFCWFASPRFFPYVVLARLLGKKIIIVAGGYDVADVPEIQYGCMNSKIKSILVKLMLRMANKIFPVSKSNMKELLENTKISSHKVVLIRHGLNGKISGEAPSLDEKEKLVLTVGLIDQVTLLRKGLITIAKVSSLLPNISFIFAGSCNEKALQKLKRYTGSNVHFTGFVSEEHLHELFRRAKVYIQPSLHEAFGFSVGQAMLFNCIPVVSNRYALPEVVGKSGFVVNPDDVNEIAKAVAQAIILQVFPDETPRNRILEKFPLAARQEKLVRVMTEVLSHK